MLPRTAAPGASAGTSSPPPSWLEGPPGGRKPSLAFNSPGQEDRAPSLTPQQGGGRKRLSLWLQGSPAEKLLRDPDIHVYAEHVLVTSFGKSVFADVTEGLETGSLSIGMGPRAGGPRFGSAEHP